MISLWTVTTRAASSVNKIRRSSHVFSLWVHDFLHPPLFWRVIQRENGIQRIGRRSGYHDIIFDDISPSARGRLYCMLSRTTDVLQSHISEREKLLGSYN